MRAADFDDDDDYLKSLIASARDHVERYCGAVFAEQTMEAECTSFADMCRLPVTPVTEVASIAYVDSEGTAATLPDTVYELRGDGLVLRYGQTWPAIQSGSLITLTAVAGFVDCPAAVKHAMLLWIQGAYATRSSAEQANWTTMDALLSNYRFYQ